MTKKKMLPVLMLSIACILGCTKGDPPCPSGVLNVTQHEADEGLRRRAQKEVDAGKGKDVAANFRCGYQEVTPGMYRALGEIELTFIDVMVCAVIAASHPPMTLTDCMQMSAREKMAGGQLIKNPSAEALAKAVDKTHCSEVSRAASVEADKHSLSRSGEDDWVPAVLWGTAVLVADKAGQAVGIVTAPGMFVIKLAAGDQQTCYETPSGPSKGCLAEDGCGGAPPGATVPGSSTGAGGGLIPPGTDPGTPLPPDGDYR